MTSRRVRHRWAVDVGRFRLGGRFTYSQARHLAEHLTRQRAVHPGTVPPGSTPAVCVFLPDNPPHPGQLELF